jgi:serine/threonine protein kinase
VKGRRVRDPSTGLIVVPEGERQTDRIYFSMVTDGSTKQRVRPEWLQQYELVGKIGEGTYGLVYLARSKHPSHR